MQEVEGASRTARCAEVCLARASQTCRVTFYASRTGLERTNGALGDALLAQSEIVTRSALQALISVAIQSFILACFAGDIAARADTILVTICGPSRGALLSADASRLSSHQERIGVIQPARVAVFLVLAATLARVFTLGERRVLELVNRVLLCLIVISSNDERLQALVSEWIAKLLERNRDRSCIVV